MKASVFIACSLDGFIAHEDGGLDWLPVPAGPDDEDYGYKAFEDTVDVIVMGRNTFDIVQAFESWPYRKPVVVLTHRPLPLPPKLPRSVEAMEGPPAEVVARLRDRGARHLYVDGGRTIQAFLAAGLIQRIVVTRVPVLLGRGIPLFGALPADVRLGHVATRSYPTGLVQSEYEVLA